MDKHKHLSELADDEPVETVFTEHGGDSLWFRYQVYLAEADDGHGNEFFSGMPLKTYGEWLES